MTDCVVPVPQPRIVRPRPDPGNRRCSLRTILAVPFVVQALVITGIVGWLSYDTATRAVDDLTHRSMRELLDRIDQVTQKHLEEAALAARLIDLSARSGSLRLDDRGAVERFFWNATTTSRAAQYLYLGTPHGEFTGVERVDRPAPGVVVRSRDRNGDGVLRSFAASAPGDRSLPIAAQSVAYDPRSRPWYEQAAAAGKPVWSDVYPSASKRIPVITHALPITRGDGALEGVLGIDISLDHLSRYLSGLQVSRSGVAFIVDRYGEIVAWSIASPVAFEQGAAFARVKAEHASNLLVSSITRQAGYDRMLTEPGKLLKLGAPELDDDLIAVGKRLDMGNSVDWLMVVAAPAADFTGAIASRTRWTAAVGALALLAAIAFGWVALRWLTRDLARLADAAGAIVDGRWHNDLPTGRNDEVGDVARAFASMTHALSRSQGTIHAQSRELQAANATLEERIRRRTAELAGANRALEREIAERRRSEYLARRLASVVEHSPESIAMYDRHGVLEYVNPAFERTSGYALAELRGRTCAELKRSLANWRCWEDAADAMRQGEVHTEVMARERKNGSSYIAEVTIVRVSDEAGGSFGWVAIGRDVTERELARAQLQRQALTDPLTGLLNRAAFIERLDHMLEGGKRQGDQTGHAAVLFLDLNDFKHINDSLGHAVGDAVLIEIGARISTATRQSDLAGRLGGDEFAVALANVSAGDAQRIAEKLMDVIAAPVQLQPPLAESGASVMVRVSIGIASAPRDGHTAASLLQRADQAMYRAKRAAGGRRVLQTDRTRAD